jgi:signal peptidase I
MRRFVKDLLLPVAVAIALAFVIQASIAKPYEIPTGSMIPTIEPHDRIIANRLIYKFRSIHRGDIIVFEPPRAAKLSCEGAEATDNVPFVKRVIGVPGDRVKVVANGPTLVNGTPFVVANAGPNPQTKTFPVVPPDRLLVLGDNRSDSCDSHMWTVNGPPDTRPAPFVPQGNVIGQAEITYWPLSHFTFF